MLRATLSGMRHRKRRLLLSGMAVVLGVMFVAGSLVVTDTLGRSFDDLFADAYAEIDVHVRGELPVAVSELEGEEAPPALPADTVQAVAEVPGVAEATGLVAADGARLIGADGKVISSFGPPRMGINWTGDEPRQLREGREPRAPDEIAVNADLAGQAGVSVGDRVGVLTRQPREEFTLVGTFGYAGGRDTMGGVQEVAFTDRTAQQLMLGETDAWSAVSVRAADGVTPQHLRDELAAALGDGYVVRTGEQLAADQAGELKEGLTFVNYILLGFAGVALFVGTFLILNTFSIIVAQRLRELALTRAVGASRRQIVGSVLLEAVLVGLFASAIGLAAGVGIGALLANLAAGFAALPLASLAVPASAAITAFTVGIVVTVVAAVLPALRASRVPPVAALQEAATPDRPLTRLTVTGAVTGLAGAGLLVTGLLAPQLWLVLGAVLLLLVAVSLLAPVVVRPATAMLGWLFSRSVPGRLGRLNSARNPRRTAITAAALMIGVSLVSGVNVVMQSAKTSFADFFEDTVQAELLIAGEQTGPRPPTFDPAVLTHAAELPQVDAAAGVYSDEALVDDERTYVHATGDLAALSTIYGATAHHGDLRRLSSGQLAVDDTAAGQHDLSVGDEVTVQLSRGEPHTLTVGAIFEDNELPGRYFLPPQVTTDLAVPQPYLGLIDLPSGTTTEDVRPQVAQLLADSPEVSVGDRSSYIEQQSRQFDTVLTMIQVLLALAILIAVLGIINTLALSVLERTRELGLLRAVGLGRGAAMRMVTVEAVVISVFGALLGVVVGSGLGSAVVTGLRDEGITTLALPWTNLATYLLLAGLVGVVAAVLPAIRAARTDVLTAIAYE